MKVTSRRNFLGSVLGVAGLTAAGALVAACGAPEQAAAPAKEAPKTGASASTPAAAAPAAVTGKLTVWETKLFTQAANDQVKDQITKYAATKNWQVEVSDIPSDGTVMSKLMAGLESGDLPDIFASSSELPQLYGSDALLDVTSTVKELEATNGASLPLVQRGGNFKGKWWGIPWFMYADAMFVRKDVIDAAGVKVEDLATYDGFRDAALKVSDPAKQMWGWGITPKAGTGDGDIFARHLLNSFGAGISDETGEKVKLDSPETVAAVKYAVDIYTNKNYSKMLPDGVLGWTGSSNNETFLGGKLAFTWNSSSLYWAAKNQKNPYVDKTVLIQFPKGPKQELMGGYPYYNMTFKKAKNRDAAVEIGKFLALDQQVFDRTKVAEGASWPVYEKQAANQMVTDFVKTDPNYAVLLKNCTHKSGWAVGWPSQPNSAIAAVEVQFLLAKMLEDAIAGKGKPEDIVKDYHKKVVEIFNSFGFKQ